VYDSVPPSTSSSAGQAATTTVKRASADGSGGLGEFGAGRDAAMSHDAQRVLFTRDFDIISRGINGGQETGVLVGPSTDGFPVPSPDGRHLAFMTLTPTHVGVSVTPMSSPQKRLEVGTDTSWWPRWSRDGRRLFFATTKDIQQVDVYSEPTFRLGIPKSLFARADPSSSTPAPFDVSPDGERFLVVEPDKSVSRARSMVVVLNFAPEATTQSR
jgi:WD40 repeat protein